MDQWMSFTFGIEPKKKPEPPEVEMEAEDDQDVLKSAMKSSNSTGAATWIGRLSYQWFCMDDKLKVLHEFFPDFNQVPAYHDISKEVNRRWKSLTAERKQHYIDIATYQYEQQFGPIKL